MSSPSPLEKLDTWTPEQLLAVYDFCQMMGETIWQLRSEDLVDHLRRKENASATNWPATVEEENLPLPFDDDLPF